jgi:RNA polymerase sigma factor (sigma-70 family)
LSTPATGSVTHFLGQLRAGDQRAAAKLWDRYCPRLLALARRTLAGQAGPLADADDAVQSAFVSFFRRVERGGLGEQLHRDSLWNLLGTITIRKARRQLRRQRAKKRGGGRVRAETDLAGNDNDAFRLDEALADVSTADFDLACVELLEALDAELRPYAVLRLMGYKDRESAEMLDCTQRKVERKLQLVRLAWQAHLEDS